MYQFDFNFKEHGKEAPKVHFTGIGGISMSGLAEILLSKGVTVSGSDNKESAVTKHLESLGARVFIGQDEKNIASAPGLRPLVAGSGDKSQKASSR